MICSSTARSDPSYLSSVTSKLIEYHPDRLHHQESLPPGVTIVPIWNSARGQCRPAVERVTFLAFGPSSVAAGATYVNLQVSARPLFFSEKRQLGSLSPAAAPFGLTAIQREGRPPLSGPPQWGCNAALPQQLTLFSPPSRVSHCLSLPSCSWWRVWTGLTQGS